MTLRSLYVDFNSYFASVEQQLRPQLRGRPVGVLPVLAETTCCIAASYEAKAHGVKTGTPVYEATLRAAWGSVEGERMHAKLRGEEMLAAASRRASVSHSHVLPPELRNDAAAYSVLHRLLQKAAMRLRSYAPIAGNLHLRVKYRDPYGEMSVWRADRPVDPTADTLAFLHALDALWRQRPKRTPFAVGVALTALDDAAHRSRDLFDDGHDHDRLNAVIDAVNLRFGKNTLYFGGAHRALAAAPMRIAFQHIPDLDVEAD